MKIAIVGSRGFDDYDYFCEIIDLLVAGKQVEFVSGGAKGADRFAEKYAIDNNIEIIVIPAEWEIHGKAAGYIRNKDIWNNADFGVAFWDGQSKGTAHSFNISKTQGKDILIVNYITREVELRKQKNG